MANYQTLQPNENNPFSGQNPNRTMDEETNQEDSDNEDASHNIMIHTAETKGMKEEETNVNVKNKVKTQKKRFNPRLFIFVLNNNIFCISYRSQHDQNGTTLWTWIHFLDAHIVIIKNMDFGLCSCKRSLNYSNSRWLFFLLFLSCTALIIRLCSGEWQKD